MQVDDVASARRRIGLWSAVFLVVANMVGAGVFTTTGFSLEDLGDRGWVLAAWAIGGVIALLGAISYGAFGSRVGESGGEYVLLAREVHPLAGFLVGWISLVAGFTAPIAVSALLIPEYVGMSGTAGSWLATAVILVAGLVHSVRLSGGVGIQNSAVILKLAAIAVFVAWGGWHVAREGATKPSASVHDALPLGIFATTLVWISFSYSGWNAAVYVLGELRVPGRNLVRALVIGTGLVTLVYMGLNAVFLFAARPEALVGRPDVARIAADAIGGSALRDALSSVIALALFTSITSMVMIGPRVYAKMADDGLFPRLFRFEGEVPTRAVLLQCLLAVLVVWISELRELLGFIGFTLGLSTAFAVLVLMNLRRREGPSAVPIPGYPWIPAAFVGFTLFAAGFMAVERLSGKDAGEILAAFGVLAAGALLYLLTGRGKAR